MPSTPIVCPSAIRRVEVYARGALVTREVALPDELPQSPCELAVRGVSPLLDTATLGTAIDGDRPVVGISSRLYFPDSGQIPGDLSEKVRRLRRQRMRLEAERSELFARRDALVSLTPEVGIFPRSPRFDAALRIADGLAAVDLIDEVTGALDKRIAELEDALERHSRDLAAAELVAQQARSIDLAGAGHPSREVIVRLAAGVGPAHLAITYAVPTARWWPAYTLRLEPATEQAELSLEALVLQASFEDWEGVELALCTADLARDATLPELPSWRLGRAQPRQHRGYRPPPADLDALFSGYDKAIGGALAAPEPSPPPYQPAPLTKPAPTPPPPSAAPLPYDARRREMAAEEQTFGFAADLEVEPAPSYMMAAPAKSRSGLLGGLARAAAVPVMASAGLASSLAPKGERQKMDYGPPGGAIAAIEEEGYVLPADAWLDFDALVMAGGDEGQRGRLVPRTGPTAGAARTEALEVLEDVEPLYDVVDPADSRGEFDHLYLAEAPADIPSNHQIHRVEVATANGTTSSHCRTVPLEVAEVYREVRLQNPFEAPLLTGPVDIFVNGAMVTTATLEKVDRGGRITLGLGVEDRLKVARNVRVEEGSGGLFGGRTDIEHHVDVELSSSLGVPITVDVVDRVPVTDDDEVEIELLASTPPHEPYDQAERGEPVRGGILWTLKVPPGEKAKATLRYVIRVSSKREIVGGNRRD